VEDFVVEHLGDVTRVDAQGDGCVNEGHPWGVVLKYNGKIFLLRMKIITKTVK
jgi:hypothetical protein